MRWFPAVVHKSIQAVEFTSLLTQTSLRLQTDAQYIWNLHNVFYCNPCIDTKISMVFPALTHKGYIEPMIHVLSEVRIGPLQSLLVAPVAVGNRARAILECRKRRLKGTNGSYSYQLVNSYSRVSGATVTLHIVYNFIWNITSAVYNMWCVVAR